LPTDLETIEGVYSGCLESGWSQQDSHQTLQKTSLTLIDTGVCQSEVSDFEVLKIKYYKLNVKTSIFHLKQVPDTSFCGGNVNHATVMCPGYTGSPVTCDNVDAGSATTNQVLVGLQSFNWACNVENEPGVYTSIRELRQWIDYILEKEYE
jgi:secreted trypsin-like serine protease